MSLNLLAVCKVIINAIAIIKAIDGSLVAVNTITNANPMRTKTLSIKLTRVGGNLGAANAAYKPIKTLIVVEIYTLSNPRFKTVSLVEITSFTIVCTCSIYIQYLKIFFS